MALQFALLVLFFAHKLQTEISYLRRGDGDDDTDDDYESIKTS